MLRCGGVAVVGPSPVPVRLLEAAPWVLGIDCRQQSRWRRWPGRFPGRKFRAASVCGGSRSNWRENAHAGRR